MSKWAPYPVNPGYEDPMDTPAGFSRSDPSAMGDRIDKPRAMTADLREALKRIPRYALSTDNGHIVQSQRGAWVRFEDLRALDRLPTAPAPEPVAWRYRNQNGGSYFLRHDKPTGELAELQPLYASPPHQTESETREEIRKELSFDFPSPTGDEDK